MNKRNNKRNANVTVVKMMKNNNRTNSKAKKVLYDGKIFYQHPTAPFLCNRNGVVIRIKSPLGSYEVKPYVDRRGYLAVGFMDYDKGCMCLITHHKLVYEAITGELLSLTTYGDGLVLDHKDNDKHNNHYKNLQVITSTENKRKNPRGCKNKVGNKIVLANS